MILQILNELASTLKISEKEAILKRNAGNDLLKEIFRITYTKQIMFHIKKFPQVDGKPGTTPLSNAIADLMSDLATRKYTGNAARDRLLDIVSSVNENDREVLRRIINRDLECGAGTTLPNRVWKKLIPEQPQCLATPFSEKALKRIRFPAYSQLKADGARCMSDLLENQIRKATRAGNEYEGLVNLDKDLKKIRDYLGYDVVLDGELIYVPAEKTAVVPSNSVPFSLAGFMGDDDDSVSGLVADVRREATENETQAEAKREEGNGIVNKSLKGTISDEEQRNIVYVVWDIVPYEVYYGDAPSVQPYCDRFSILEGALAGSGVTSVKLIPSILVQNYAEAKKDYNNYRNDGKEGSILKNVDFKWKDSRVADQVKLKNKTPIELRIIDVYEHTKEPHKVGGFVVEDLSGEARTNTGSGLTDTDYRYDEDGINRVYIPLEERGELDREYIMANKDDYIGAIVEMEVDGLQKSKTRKKGEPEFSFFLPIIKKIRRDKTEPDDIHVIFADLF
ncbi:DNA ligase [Citrobacter phage Maroon]|uniref:DNA ligase n=1 Tax=Citrobacter phage Maroon TaxID=2315469 RepID=A0A3B8DIG8_9CAUD|nr:DNA ligase [Citrobacter phage Maroon]